MVDQAEMSPPVKARVAGAFYLLSVATAILAEIFVHGRLLYAVGLIPVLCFATVTLFLFAVFKPVSSLVATLAAASNLAGLIFEALERHPFGINAALVFHGIYCLLVGYFCLRSSFLPRIFGFTMAVAGLAWQTALSPHLSHAMHFYTQALGFSGEGTFMLWILFFGVNAQKYPGRPS